MTLPIAELTAPALFVAGASTSLHCTLMCGAINAAQLRSAGPLPLHRTLALVHGGRVLGYALLGLLAGALGARLAFWLPDTLPGRALQALAALALIAAGLQQFGGRPPISRRGHAACAGAWGTGGPGPFARGLLWALMPCGILYTVLLFAALTANPLAGFVLLGAFGLGTVPLMGLGGGLLARAARARDTRALRYAGGTALVVLGCAGLAALAWQPDLLSGWLCTPT